MPVINTNIASITASRTLGDAQRSQETAMERLSTGLRINSAKDDAAGLGIATGMTSEIRGLSQAARNVGAAIALVDTADNALGQSSDILQRMREISVQASNSTLNANDRAALKVEMDALTAEIDRIASATNYNSQSLIDGSATGMNFQVGSQASQNVTFSIGAATTSGLGLDSSAVTTTSLGVLNGAQVNENNTTIPTAAIISAVDDVFINGVDFAASLTTDTSVDQDGTVTSNTFTTEAASGLVRAINTNTEAHGVTATAKSTLSGMATDGVTTASDFLLVEVDSTGSSVIHTMAATNSVQQLIDEINIGGSISTTDGDRSFTASLNAVGGIDIVSNVGNTLQMTGAGTFGGFLQNQVAMGELTLTSKDGSDISITRGDNVSATDDDVRALGFNVTTSASVVKGTQVAATNYQRALTAADDMTINGVQIGATDSSVATANTSAATLAAAVNAVSDQTGVTATAETVIFLDLAFGASLQTTQNAANGTLTVNGVTTGNIAATSTQATVVSALQTAFNTNGLQLTATAEGTSRVKLVSSTGADIMVKQSATANEKIITGVTHEDGSTTDAAGTDSAGSIVASYFTFGGALTLTNTKGGSIEFGYDTVGYTEAQTDFNKLGFKLGQSSGGSSTTTGGVSLDSVASASAALTSIDTAIQKLSEIRGGLGALQNRFDYTLTNLETAVESASASRSQILDADFAAESASLAKSQVLAQASTAMLAQANAAPQMVLQLLQ